MTEFHRLLAGSYERVAIYSAAGQLLCATQSAHTRLNGTTSLSALGAQQLAASALTNGHAAGRIGDQHVSISRLGGESATVLALNFGLVDQQEPVPAASAPKHVAPNAVRAASSVLVQESGTARSVAVQGRAPAERRHPLRFVWQMDELGRFNVSSEEFIKLVGAATAVAMGKPWGDLASELGLDREGQIARAITTQDTWSGLTVSWPVEQGKGRLPVELSGLPVFDRERVFRGYRGFGVCRDLAKLNALAANRDEAVSAARKSPGQERQQETALAQESHTAAKVQENVVRFPATAHEITAPALTEVEHMAFRELSRKLTQGLAAAGVQSGVKSASLSTTERATPAHEMSVGTAASDGRPILDRLPIGVLIYRLDQLLYANGLFLQVVGLPDT